ncbi:glucose-1-phosphate cytidylyltransferase [Candidatus Babeliales bacterium]|nr:glucose-1-phosphate cytidylyltransferase [Candidatus Babeliales bacterium]
MKNNVPVMILAGGYGTRLREETEFKPKPMVLVGGKPIIWHIMKIYSSYGFRRFIVCLGYKGDVIRNYFLNYRYHNVDFTINTQTGSIIEHQMDDDRWEITLVDTGSECLTGGRIARAARYVNTDYFMCTYGDGVADVDINKLVDFHLQHGQLATLTGVRNPFRFGNLKISKDVVAKFSEKAGTAEDWINGGFFVFNRGFLKYLSTESSCILEQHALPEVVRDRQLKIYKHHGFWQCMDTIRDHEKLEQLWLTGAPWKKWETPPAIKPAVREKLDKNSEQIPI